MANSATWKPAPKPESEPGENEQAAETPGEEGKKISKKAEKEIKPVTFSVGDTVRVLYKLIEKEKVSGKTKREVHEETRERTQAFEGIVIAIKGSAENTMIMVRRIGAGAIGIERIFPLVSPWIKNMEVVKHGQVRRAKLYYLRHKKGKEALRVNETDALSATAG